MRNTVTVRDVGEAYQAETEARRTESEARQRRSHVRGGLERMCPR